MGIAVGNEKEKSQLIKEICDISTRPASCVHGSLFIDWYLILKVNENAELDAIRKQYHKLALQLHPDKNNHSKAETAFKLVSEAYFCLSDDARRAAFDSERKSTYCSECNSTNPSHHQIHAVKVQTPNQNNARFSRIRRKIKELRSKLKEEAIIIDNCLISSARKTSSEVLTLKKSCTRTELPVFNPSDYQNKGYPRHRTINHEKLRADFIMMGSRWMQNSTKGSPVFECPQGRVPFTSKSTSTRGNE